MVQAWVVFPLVLGALSLGLGLLVERLGGVRLPTPLLLPVGSATIVVVSSLGVLLGWPAEVTPLLTGLAATGLVVGALRRVDGAALAAAAGVFVCFGAPVLASGTPTFAGYIKLDDTATFLALVDRAMEHGRSLASLPPSTYETTLAVNLGHGYPLGALLPLGVGHELVRLDVAWLYQPWISWNAAMLALCLYALVGRIIRRGSLRAIVAFVAAQPALLYGYGQWGGVKEVTAAALVATALALAAEIEQRHRVRSLVPLALACAAVLDTLSVAGAVWLIPLAVGVVALSGHAMRGHVAGLVVAGLLALPALAAAPEFLRTSNRATFASGTELGNLIHPLRAIQVLGIWPSGDFRLDPHAHVATGVLLLLATVAGLIGIAHTLARRVTGPLLAAGTAGVGALVFVVFGGPWVAGKALAVGSPFVLLAVAIGCVDAVSGVRRLKRDALGLAVAAATLASAVAVVAGVMVSNALAYHDASLAPFSQLAELQQIGARFAGDGPSLMTEYQPYGVRHFLRRLDAEGVSELRRRPIFLRDGRSAAKAEYVDLDRVRLRDLLVYRTLVLRRSPTESRPPLPYRPVWSGRWYSVWQQRESIAIASHEPLGNALEPAGRTRCEAVNRLRSLGHVAVFARPLNLAWSLDRRPLPSGWTGQPGGAVIPSRSGTQSFSFFVPTTTTYRVWVGGSIRGRLSVAVDGARIGAVSRQLQNAGQWLELDTVTIPSGDHRMTIDVALPTLAPGAGGGGFPLGPLLLEPVTRGQLLELPTAAAGCSMNLDWIEALGTTPG